MNENIMEEDEQFNQAFGELVCREEIKRIKNNKSDGDHFLLEPEYSNEFTNLAWRLLGRYIANNIYLKKLDFDDCSLTDEKMGVLLGELTSSVSLERLDLDGNEFGVSGVRCMIPLLQNSPNLSIFPM